MNLFKKRKRERKKSDTDVGTNDTHKLKVWDGVRQWKIEWIRILPENRKKNHKLEKPNQSKTVKQY